MRYVAVTLLLGLTAGRTSHAANIRKAKRDQVSFLSVGDWGIRGLPLESVAAQMGRTARQKDSAFVLALGDNFYETGVVSDTDPQWQTTYESVFTADSLQIPFYAIRGNHDMMSNPAAEIDFYLNNRDERWYMPAQNYTIHKRVCASSDVGDCTVLQLVFIDTQTLVPESNDPEVIMPEDADAVVEGQWSWIEDTLAASTADWLLVVGHYPVFSRGLDHGDTPGLIERLRPLLEKHRVDAYISGHDHTLQHMQSNGVQYFVSGNGCLKDTLRPSSRGDTIFADSYYGFMLHEVSNDEMTTSAIGHDGRVLHTFTQKAWRRNPNGHPTLAKPLVPAVDPPTLTRTPPPTYTNLLFPFLLAFSAFGMAALIGGVLVTMIRRRRRKNSYTRIHGTPTVHFNHAMYVPAVYAEGAKKGEREVLRKAVSGGGKATPELVEGGMAGARGVGAAQGSGGGSGRAGTKYSQ